MNKKEYSRVGRDKDKGFRAGLKLNFIVQWNKKWLH